MQDLENKIKSFLEERNWHKLRPGDLAKSIVLESAELLEIFQWSNPDIEEVKKDSDKVEEIKKELADVIIYALDLSVTMGFDTEQIVLDKLKKVQEKYPADIVKNTQGDPGTEKIYKDIKRNYRQEGKN